MQPSYERQSKVKLVTTIVTVIVIAGIVLITDHLKAKSSATTTATTATTTQPASTATTSQDSSATTSTTSTSAYKDGTYTASSSYYVPHGNEDIAVTLTLKDGVVTSSSITNSEGDRDSAVYQEDFASLYKSYVVGKSISGLKIGVIAGASDTTQGFNDALSQISSKAQA